MNVYYDPEKFGLQPVGEIDWSDGCYQFDYTVVWRRLQDGALLWAEDSGCSCPSPFEGIGVNDLNVISSVSDFQAHLDKRAADAAGWCYDDEDKGDFRAMERANLLAKLV